MSWHLFSFPLSLFLSFHFFSLYLELCSCRSNITLPIWFIVAIESYCHIFATASFFPFISLLGMYGVTMTFCGKFRCLFSTRTFSESFWALWIRNGLHWIGRNFSPSASSQRIIAILYSHSILHECSFVYRHPFYYGCSG